MARSNEDVDQWIFNIEQYYCEYKNEMEDTESGTFVNTVFSNLGTVAQTWYREFTYALREGEGEVASWPLFKDKIRERFLEKDLEMKVLSKLHDLRVTGVSQQEYTTRFQQLLSQLKVPLPEIVKRWFYQQHLRPETNAFVSQQMPATLEAVVECAQRYEDSRPSSVSRKPEPPVKSNGKTTPPAGAKTDAKGNSSTRPSLKCDFCVTTNGHTTADCRRKKAAEAAGTVPAGKQPGKKLVGSVGWPPTEPEATYRACSTRSAGQPSPPRSGVYLHTEAVVAPRRKDNIYCYLAGLGTINKSSVTAFIDNGASFNAIDPSVADRLGLPVTEHENPLTITVGNNKQVIIPRRTTRFRLVLDGFPEFDTEAFVMTVPENKHVLLGMPWLTEVNPEIDWSSKTMRHRDSSVASAMHPCVRASAATTVQGARHGAPRAHRAPVDSFTAAEHDEVMLHYAKHAHRSQHGSTQVTTPRQLRRMRMQEGDFVSSFRSIPRRPRANWLLIGMTSRAIPQSQYSFATRTTCL